jgi:hypothetical protein
VAGDVTTVGGSIVIEDHGQVAGWKRTSRLCGQGFWRCDRSWGYAPSRSRGQHWGQRNVRGRPGLDDTNFAFPLFIYRSAGCFRRLAGAAPAKINRLRPGLVNFRLCDLI